jgi:cytochrome c biogenesis protein CcmG, thiol:disulfide interchange protein DsbE
LVAVRRQVVPIFVSLAAACLVGLLVYGVSAQSASRTLDDRVADHQPPRAPDPATRLPLLGRPGETSLAAYRGKVVLLNFWASWCQPCQTEAPLLQRAQAQLQRAGATVLGVTYEDASPDSLSFMSRYHLTYPNARDGGGAFVRAYGTAALPESFIVDRDGRIVAISRGEIGEPFVDRALALARSA